MELFNQFMEMYGLEIIGTVLVALAGALGLWLKSVATDFLNDKKKQDIAKIVVQGVEQVYKGINGKDKLEHALEMFSDLLEEKGIVISELEMRILLESAVGEFNDVFQSDKTQKDGHENDDITGCDTQSEEQ
jgi:hypothetical protein